MESAQKRQKSWFSSFTGLVGGGGSRSFTDSPAATTNTNGGSSVRASYGEDKTPLRPTVSFTAPSIDSPESPAKRASPSMMAQRKIHERVQGPSGKLATIPPKITNFSSAAAATPRTTSFRDSVSRDMPSFAFTPRVSMKASFPPATPGRSYRAPGAEIHGRGMSKTSTADLFAMKIPEPDSKLSGEEIAKLVPKNVGPTGSIYADEYLAHLCPPGFNEEQRRQFFCILDLRRLKYAADEIFLSKDWKLNILNFAKEYEKNRSLIMLRYGLYEFKTVKVSKDVFQKWKAANNVPDGEEEVASTPAPKVNGTEGILRAGKRKADEDLQPKTPSAQAASPGQNKRARAAERPPLAETSTPALNKTKRKADNFVVADESPRAKMQKPAPSATKAFFEKVANTPAKEAAPAAAPAIQVTKPSASSTPSTLKPKPNPFFQAAQASKPANGGLARSVLDAGLKAAPAPSNIFGYLSDASSAKGSGNDHADADGEDTDDSDQEPESETQEVSEPSVAASGSAATPQPGATGFASKRPAPAMAAGSSASSSASETGMGRSIFDRINKGSDGQPIRVLPQDTVAPQFGSKTPSEREPSPEKEPVGPPANKTWNPDTPIKFSASQATPVFGAKTANATPSIFAPKESTTPALGFKFGSATAAKAPEAPAQEASKEAPKEDNGKSAIQSQEPPKEVPQATSAPSLFAFSAQQAPISSAPSTSNLFGAVKAPVISFAAQGAAAKSQEPEAPKALEKEPAAPAASLFGAVAKEDPTKKPASTSSSVLQSQTLFGSTNQGTSQPSGALFGVKPAESGSAASIFGNVPKTGGLFGSAPAGSSSTAADATSTGALFGNPSNNAASAAFKFGTAKPDTTSEAEKPSAGTTEVKPLFGTAPTPASAPQEAKPLFGATSVSQAEPPKTQPSIFGNAPASSSSIFSFGGAASQAPAVSFGAPASQAPTTQASGPVLFGGAGGAAGATSATGPSGGSVSAPSSFNFSFGGGGDQSIRNPFATGDSSSTPGQAGSSFNFGQTGSASFQFGAGGSSAAPGPTSAPAPVFAFGGTPQTTQAPAPSATLFGGAPNSGSSAPSFAFGGAAQPSSLFSQQPASSGPSLFNLAPMGGTSTGTNTPFTFGGASSLATTPAAGTPEPGPGSEPGPEQAEKGQQADGEEGPQEQISLTEGGPGEEDESVVHEVRAKALKLVTAKDGDSESEPSASKDAKKNPWKTMGVGPLRVLKHKTTGAVRLLLRAEPRGHVALNKAILPDFSYKPEPGGKYVKLTTANDSGSGLETWMLQVKTKEAAQALADVLEASKGANRK